MTPLESAARALVDNYPLDGGESPLSWQEVLPVVRAVFQAIREPSEAMIEAWFDADLELPDGVSFEAPADIVDRYHAISDWKAMIDAAIEEG